MTSGTLLVIDPSMDRPETEGVAGIAARWPGETVVRQPALRGDGPAPGAGYDLAGIVLLGSRASPHDDLPWADALAVWLRPVLTGTAAVPLLGVCYGHQLLAHLLGGEVAFMTRDHAKRVGVEISEIRGSRLLPDADLRVVVSHREIVTRLPPTCRAIARRPGVDVDGFEHADLPIFGVQFHPEARGEFAGRAGIPLADIDARLERDSGRVIDAFLRLAGRSRPDRPEKKRAGGRSAGPRRKPE